MNYEKNNIKYAFISYTMWNNGLTTPAGKEYLNNVYSEERNKNVLLSWPQRMGTYQRLPS